MFNTRVADESDRNIRAIFDEVSKNESLLNQKIKQSQLLEKQIPAKETTVSELEGQLDVLHESTSEMHERVNTLTKRKESLIAQNSVLKRLYSEIQSNIKRNSDVDAPELTDDQKNQVKERLEFFFSTLNEEFEPQDISALHEELKRVKEQRQKVEDEISILKQVSGTWDPNDEVENAIDDYSLRISPEVENLKQFHISTIFGKNPSLLECSVNAEESPELSSTFSALSELEEKIRDIQESKEKNKEIFDEQLKFLKHLKNATIQSNDKEKMISKISRDIDELTKTGSEEIKPLTIPEAVTASEEADPVSAIVEDFKAFSEELTSQLPPKTIFDDAVKKVEKNLEIPEYESPKVTVERHVAASDDLVQLTRNLQRIYDSAQIELPEPPVFAHETKENTNEEKEELQEAEEMEEFDNSAMENLIRLAKMKLPEVTLKGLGDTTKNSEEEEKEEEEVIEIVPSEETKKAINNFQSILKEISSIEFPTDPSLLRPQQVTESIVRVEKVEKEPILKAVENYLNPQQEISHSLEVECSELKKKIEKLRQHFDNQGGMEDIIPDEEVEKYVNEERQLQEELENIKEKVGTEMDKLRKIGSKRKETADELAELKKKHKELDNFNVSELQEMVAKKREELANLKKTAKEEIESYKMLFQRK